VRAPRITRHSRAPVTSRSRVFSRQSSSLQVPALTDVNFYDLVEDSEKPLVLDIYANNHPASELLGQKLQRWLQPMDWRLNFAKLPVNQPEAKDMIQRLDVNGELPMLLGFYKGQRVTELSGRDTTNDKRIEEMLSTLSNYI